MCVCVSVCVLLIQQDYCGFFFNEICREKLFLPHDFLSSGVLEEVLAAQKDRDQALMSRLLLANEERDEAVLHARQLQEASQ